MSDIWKKDNPEDASDGIGEPMPLVPQGHLPGTRGIPFGSGLGKYRILDRIRTLHHAIVYKARDSMLDRLVVIKQMNPSLLDDPLACGDFKREAQLLARVPKDARNVIGIHELIGDEQGLFIVEEFTPGDWLEVLLSKRQVGVADALRILKYAGLGLRALHARKIVHRDIQPSNLLICPGGQVRIANFAGATHEGDHTPPAAVSPKYAAPELLLGMPHDDRVDIYSLGFTVYEVCVGRRALHSHFHPVLRGPDSAVAFWRDWHSDLSLILPSACSLNASVPPALATILHKMTAKDVDERYGSVDEVLQDVIRKFSNSRGNVSPAIAGAAGAAVLDARPGVAALPGAGRVGDGRQPQSLLWLAKPESLTTTQSVDVNPPASHGGSATRALPGPAAQPPRAPAKRTVRVDVPARPSVSGVRPDQTPKRVTSLMKTRTAEPPASIPTPEPVEDPTRKRRQLLIPIAAAVLLLAAAWIGGNYYWSNVYHPKGSDSILALMNGGREAFLRENTDAAHAKFLEAYVKASSDPNLEAAARDADNMLILVDAQKALAGNNFDAVEAKLHDATTRGADAASLAFIRTKFEAKRSAMNLAREGVKAAKSGDFVEADLKVEPYAENAVVAGLDPASLKDDIQKEKDDRDYDQAIERGRKALEQNDFEAAMVACRDAQNIRITTATRQLRQDIADAKTRFDWMVRGDKAMRERDYSAAESAYQSANASDPNEQVEQKLRIASSMRLYVEARELIRNGDLLSAKNRLESSLWKHPLNRQARAKLTSLSRAFDAAQLVANADRELANGNVAEAIRLYEKAIPDLVAPADDIARGKLNKLKLSASQPAAAKP